MSVDPGAALSQRFELGHTRLEIAGRAYDLLRPRNIDDLVSEEDFAIDDRIPYWADCWPSARVMAERISRESGQGRRLLELGCGIGLVSLAAAHAGFDVLATDYYSEALEFTAANATRHGLNEIDTRLVDWRRWPDDLETFDFVVASDVLYEGMQAGLVAGALARALAVDGVGLVSDPGRRTAPAFIERCLDAALDVHMVERVTTVEAGSEMTISIFNVRHGRARS